MKLLLPVLLLLSFIQVQASDFGLYGPDDRKDLYQVTDPVARRVADSSVAIFTFLKLGGDEGGRISVSTETLQSSQNLCDGQAFDDQPTAPYCSGVLVAPDVVMTAGHCVKSWIACMGIKIAFGYSVRQPGVMPETLAASDVYSCDHVIHSQDDDNEPDFALIRLDRPVTDHAPLALDRSATQKIGDAVFAIGYPNGLPLKVAGNARIRSVEDTDFTANLDMFEGNSGSPVFNAKTGLIEGILVEGGDDFTKKHGGSCQLLKQYPNDGGPGEISTSVSAVLPYLPR